MLTLHDPAHRSALESRVRALRPDSPRRWGKMSADQMLWHVNAGLAVAVGELTAPVERPPLPRPVMKFLILNLPWPKGAPTSPAFRAEASYDFQAERIRCLRLIGTLAGQSLDRLQHVHPILGRMSGTDVSRLQAKHLDHHLKQFGV